MPRTNNALEAFHGAFNTFVTNSHPNVWKLITVLKKEEALAQLKKVQFDRGDQEPETKRTYKDVNLRIKKILERYNPNDLDSLSTKVHNVRFSLSE